jgi:lipopolysaccharide/colanic/teichoic acid biosynthesis glycosyltransferase
MPAETSAATTHVEAAFGLTTAPRAMPLQTGILKTTLDHCGSATALLLLSPVFAVIALISYLSQDGPIFFAHTRIGKGGKEFGCLKFRTMVPKAEEILAQILASDPIAREEWNTNFKFEHDPRITRFGAFLRKTSLDELPQFLNVLVGEMSLVGPRPITRKEGALYGRHFAAYKSIRPGITGLWQISGRSDTTYDQRVALDVSYIRDLSFVRDVQILFLTVLTVLLRRGAV